MERIRELTAISSMYFGFNRRFCKNDEENSATTIRTGTKSTNQSSEIHTKNELGSAFFPRLTDSLGTLGTDKTRAINSNNT